MKRQKKFFDVKLVGLLAFAYSIVILVAFGKNAFLKSHGVHFQDISWRHLIVNYYVFDWIAVTLFMTLVALISKRMLEKKTSYTVTIAVHAFFSVLLNVIVFLMAVAMELISGQTSITYYTWDNEIVRFVYYVDLNFLTYVYLVTVIYVYYYFNLMKVSENKKTELQKQLIESRLSLLQSQLNPHFLFNTLNSIHSLMEIDKEKSKNMIVDLSHILRDVLEHKDSNLIELQDEIFILKKYLNIKKTRFSEDLRIHLKVEKGLENVLIPTMILQPIVENSIKHGYGTTTKILEIAITIYSNLERLVVVITNNGNPINQDIHQLKEKGFGLKNISNRLKTLYKTDFQFDMINENGFVKTTLQLPMKLSESVLVSAEHLSKNLDEFNVIGFD